MIRFVCDGRPVLRRRSAAVSIATVSFSKCYMNDLAPATMSEHTKTDGLPDVMPDMPRASMTEPVVLDKSRPRSERMASDKIECNACPVLCQISPGKTGACDRYANASGVLVRVDPVVLLRRTLEHDDA